MFLLCVVLILFQMPNHQSVISKVVRGGSSRAHMPSLCTNFAAGAAPPLTTTSWQVSIAFVFVWKIAVPVSSLSFGYDCIMCNVFYVGPQVVSGMVYFVLLIRASLEALGLAWNLTGVHVWCYLRKKYYYWQQREKEEWCNTETGKMCCTWSYAMCSDYEW